MNDVWIAQITSREEDLLHEPSTKNVRQQFIENRMMNIFELNQCITLVLVAQETL